MTLKAKLYTDGGARGNPGPAGIGGVLEVGGRLPIEFSQYIGKATNNQAEYQALLTGLKLAQKNEVSDLSCYLDSELVVKQLLGLYKVKNEGLKDFFKEAKQMSALFEKIAFKHVPREKNKHADKLVNIAIDKA